MLVRTPRSEWVPVTLGWSSAEVTVPVEGRRYTSAIVPLPNGANDRFEALTGLACMLRNHQIDVRCCASCVRFRFSGMSRQFSGGSAGYCGMVGFRDNAGIVQIDDGCGEHEPVRGWPDDETAMTEARMELGKIDPRPSRGNAFEGCLLGLAVGDALGFPVEFTRRSEILHRHGAEGVTDFVAGHGFPPGTYTDDTQMSLAVAEALIDSGRKDLDALMTDMAGRFVRWSRSPDNNRAPGNTCMAACGNLAAGVPWREAGIARSKGCGSAMRVAAIGLYFWRDHARLLEVARASSLLTHGHDAAVEGAAAAALLVALAMEKKTPNQMYQALLDECAPRSADFRACLEKLPRLLDAEPAAALSSRGLGEAWVAEEAVVSALYCFWRSPEDFARTVLTGANTDGDSDSIAAIAGSISGAFNGAGAIPEHWRTGVENSAYLSDVADRLLTAGA